MTSESVESVRQPSSRTLNELLDYWASLCRGEAFPRREDLDPVDIPQLLPAVFLVQVPKAETEDYVFRLAGEEVCAVHGQPLRGKTVAHIMCPETADVVRAQYTEMAKDPRPRFIRFRMPTGQGRYWDYERALLPCCDDTGQVTVLLGGVAGIDAE